MEVGIKLRRARSSLGSPTREFRVGKMWRYSAQAHPLASAKMIAFALAIFVDFVGSYPSRATLPRIVLGS